jgi:hypothetical protein
VGIKEEQGVLGVTKRERLAEIVRRLTLAAPFGSGAEARLALEEIMRIVEDELSGVPENPDAAFALPDGRMYPPHDRFEIASEWPQIQIFKQTRHRTYFGANGAMKIESSEGTVMIDLRGRDGRSIGDLRGE